MRSVAEGRLTKRLWNHLGGLVLVLVASSVMGSDGKESDEVELKLKSFSKQATEAVAFAKRAERAKQNDTNSELFNQLVVRVRDLATGRRTPEVGEQDDILQQVVDVRPSRLHHFVPYVSKLGNQKLADQIEARYDEFNQMGLKAYALRDPKPFPHNHPFQVPYRLTDAETVARNLDEALSIRNRCMLGIGSPSSLNQDLAKSQVKLEAEIVLAQAELTEQEILVSLQRGKSEESGDRDQLIIARVHLLELQTFLKEFQACRQTLDHTESYVKALPTKGLLPHNHGISNSERLRDEYSKLESSLKPLKPDSHDLGTQDSAGRSPLE